MDGVDDAAYGTQGTNVTYTERLVTSTSGSVTVTTPGGFEGNLDEPMASLRVFTSCVTSSVRAHRDGHFERGKLCSQHSAHISDPREGVLCSCCDLENSQGHHLVSVRVKRSRHRYGSQDMLNSLTF
jgi:hypothetical protein